MTELDFETNITRLIVVDASANIEL
jgi:hypothetical protein